MARAPLDGEKNGSLTWSDVWNCGDNLLDLVEDEVRFPLARGGEIQGELRDPHRRLLTLILFNFGVTRPFLWGDLQLVDRETCREMYGVGPRTVFNLVSELSSIARSDILRPRDVKATNYAREFVEAVEQLEVGIVNYAFYGGSPRGFKRISMGIGSSVDMNQKETMSRNLIHSELDEARQVLECMATNFHRCGQLLANDEAFRLLWNGMDPKQIAKRYCTARSSAGDEFLSQLEVALPTLRFRLVEGSSFREIARANGRKESEVYGEFCQWVSVVPTEFFRAFTGLNDPKIFDRKPGAYDPLPLYEHPFVAGLCINCDQTLVTPKMPLYSSEVCRQTAKVIRYARSCRDDGRIELGDVQEAIQMRVAHILSGGYHEKARRLSSPVREKVLERAGGRYENCGRAFIASDPNAMPTIQHLNGSEANVENLQAWCRRCNMIDAQSRFIPVADDSPEIALLHEIRTRWESPRPLRACDDHEFWNDDWRRYERAAKDFLRVRPKSSH